MSSNTTYKRVRLVNCEVPMNTPLKFVRRSGRIGYRLVVPADKSAKELEKRIARIEVWIDLWETYDSGWNKYRRKKPLKRAKR